MRIKVVEKTKKDVEIDCRKWAKEIESEFCPDIVVFIAKSGYLMGRPIAEEIGKPLYAISANRAGNEIKNGALHFKKLIPKFLVKTIISSPIKFYLHSKKKSRNVVPSNLLKNIDDKCIENILLIDDAVDTGWTIKSVYEELHKIFSKATIKVASYVVSDYSKKVVKIDFYRYRNVLVLTATSRQSNEYEMFLEEVDAWMHENK